MSRSLRVLVYLLLAAGYPGTAASVPLSGMLLASQNCEAYQSKNRRTNPGAVRLDPGQRYTVREANQSSRADWYRVWIPQAEPPERWVASHCGTLTLSDAGGERVPAACNAPGPADSYVLALSWQPAFCEIQPQKPDCRIESEHAFQAHHFTLHGLWPNREDCRRNEYCGGRKERAFCDYPALKLSTSLRSELEIAMPSTATGTCLQRHEWFKHGTCQAGWNAEQYYALSLDLLRQFNDAGLARFMADNVGRQVSEAAFIEALDQSLGAGAHQRVTLKCKGGNLLVDVYLTLPSQVAAGDRLVDLLPRAQGRFQSNCENNHFTVDPIGFQR